MKETRRSYLELHIAVVLFGLTAILGDLITLPAVTLVWWRVLITSISLFLLIKMGKTLKGLSHTKILQLMGVGVLVAIHWITFFGAIKLANASIALVCYATTSFFTSIFEPLITKRKFIWFELMLGILIIPGMALIVNSVEYDKLLGIGIGIISAMFAALFGCFNKKWVTSADPLTITFLELSSAWIFISMVLPFFLLSNTEVQFFPSAGDWKYLLVLSLLCTTLAYVLALNALKYVTAFAANLVINLEPIYGIILAWLILQENKELSTGFYAGVLIIVGSIFIYPYLGRKNKDTTRIKTEA